MTRESCTAISAVVTSRRWRRAAGGKLIDEPADRYWGVRMFQFNDLDGFKLGVSTPLAG